MFWLGLLIAVCFVPGYTGATIATQWVVLSLVLPATLWRASPLQSLLGWCFIAYACASAVWAPNTYTAGLGLWYLAIWALSFRLGTMVDSLIPLWKGLALGLTVSTGVAIAQVLDYAPVEVNEFQYAGLLYNGTVQGLTCALVIIGLTSHRLWWYIPPLTIGIILSGSRGAILILGLYIIARYIHWLVAVAALVASALAFTFWLDLSDSMRLTVWGHALQHLSLFGWGINSFSDIYYFRHLPKGLDLVHPEYVHNDYLQLVFEYGVGSIAIFAILATALAQTRALDWPVLVAFAIIATFYFPLHCPLLAFIGCLLSGHLNAFANLRRTRLQYSGHDVLQWLEIAQSTVDRLRGPTLPVVPRTSHSEA